MPVLHTSPYTKKLTGFLIAHLEIKRKTIGRQCTQIQNSFFRRRKFLIAVANDMIRRGRGAGPD